MCGNTLDRVLTRQNYGAPLSVYPQYPIVPKFNEFNSCGHHFHCAFTLFYHYYLREFKFNGPRKNEEFLFTPVKDDATMQIVSVLGSNFVPFTTRKFESVSVLSNNDDVDDNNTWINTNNYDRIWARVPTRHSRYYNVHVYVF